MNLLRKIIFFFFFFFSLGTQAAEIYHLDPNHTYVLWHVSHFGFSSPSGKWFANGTLLLDEMHPEKSKLDVTIQIDTLVTGIPKFDQHLKSKEFLEVEKFPTATFISNKIILTGKERALVEGILTLHGISKPIRLNVKLNKIDISPITHKKTIGFTASTEFKRSLFDIKAFLPGVGDEVKINIEAEASI